MDQSSVEFKGTSFTLSILHLKTLNLSEIRTELVKKIAQAPDFFYLFPIMVDIEKVDCSFDYQSIKILLEELKFTFIGFTGSVCEEQRTLIRELGFSFVNAAKAGVLNKKNKTDVNVAEQVKETEPKETQAISEYQPYSDKVHRGQVRSGQQVYAKDQNLVVIGSVSAGAEIIADGNIHVYGSLRGRAIAGAKGHHQAQIYCQNLEAELVSINGNYWLSDSMEKNWGSPVYIQLTGTELKSSKLI
ncbi:MAG: septum site-determining protein MinC [Paraglaciecola sp.]|jgi:septum site-determining protein MinC